MANNEILLDTYPLQKDLRIRLPKQVLTNLPVEVGSLFDIYLNTGTNEIILRMSKSNAASEAEDEHA